MRASLLLLALGAACASEKKQQNVPAPVDHAVMADIMATQLKLQQAQRRAGAECAPLRDRPVPWSEERFIGLQAAVANAASGKGLYLDAAEVDPPLGRRIMKLPSGEKNALVEYVQVVGLHVASGSARPHLPWTFGVVDDPTPRELTSMGGFVLVTTGLLALLEDEAQLAAVLARGVAMNASKGMVKDYARARHSACTIALTGLYLTEAGAGATPGGEDFVRNAKFGKTMRRFGQPEGLELATDPEVDEQFVLWFMSNILQSQAMTGQTADDDLGIDGQAHQLLSSAGYDAGALAKVVAKLPAAQRLGGRSPADRAEALAKLEAVGGKSPAFPAGVKWPR